MNARAIINSGFTFAALSVLAGLPITVMAETVAIDGQFKVSYSKQEALPVPDGDGHVLVLGQAEGSNRTNAGA